MMAPRGAPIKKNIRHEKRQSKLVDGLYLVLSYKLVAVCRYHALKVEVVHFALHLAEGRINSLKLLSAEVSNRQSRSCKSLSRPS